MESRPWVLQSTLEAEVPLPLYSDQYIKLWGPRQVPLLKQALRWKTTPMGWDARGQSWSTGLSSRDKQAEQPWYTLTCSAHRCWQQAQAGWGKQDPLPPAYAQHLKEVAWWDPIIPAVYLGPCTRWGSILWQEKPILGKEYVATRSQSPQVLGSSSGYVPLLSFCHPHFTTQDISTWSLLHHQPSTHQ
ncbi:tektin bundle-interacting protein 1 [Indicator indicator]|uniref:tektin bundle-interacting protein 1 n=1 Tax=Indicator indicator TaxID=1002788 RepID=UPI0023DE76DE|nr:tektin bundle-interacting protein 1 [Indicator indicator]